MLTHYDCFQIVLTNDVVSFDGVDDVDYVDDDYGFLRFVWVCCIDVTKDTIDI